MFCNIYLKVLKVGNNFLRIGILEILCDCLIKIFVFIDIMRNFAGVNAHICDN